MFVTQPKTGSRVWIPDSEAGKVRAGLAGSEVIGLAVIAGLVLIGAGALLGFKPTASNAGTLIPVLMIIGSGLVAGTVVFSRRYNRAERQLTDMLSKFRAVRTNSMLYRLMAAQLLIRSARDLDSLLTDADDAAVYERIVANFVTMPDTITVIKSYDEAVAQNNRAAQMTAHAALVAKIDGVVEDLVGAYRMQHQ